MTAAAGLAGFRPGKFVAIDATALLLWALLWTGLGWMFECPIEVALESLVAHGNATTPIIIALIPAAIAAHAGRCGRTGSPTCA